MAAAVTARRWLLLSRRVDIGGAAALEAAAFAPPGSAPLSRALVAMPLPLAPGTLAAAVTLRAELLPLGASATPDGIVAAAHDVAAHLGGVGLAVHYETIERCSTHRDSSQTQLHDALRRAFGPTPPRVCDGSAPATAPPMRVACVETRFGYLLGLVTQAARAPWPAAADWALAPTVYCAGIKADLAGVAVNAALRARAAAGGAHGARVLDPCCGSGGVLHAAWLRGAIAQGGDCVPAMAATATANLAAFEDAVDEAHVTRLGMAAGEDAQAASSRPHVDVWDASALDCEALGFQADACVSNLPHGRMVHVGGAAARAMGGGDNSTALRSLLAALRPLARAHAFFSPAPLAPTLEALGFSGVIEVSVCRSDRRFLAVVLGDADAACVAPLCAQLLDVSATPVL